MAHPRNSSSSGQEAEGRERRCPSLISLPSLPPSSFLHDYLHATQATIHTASQYPPDARDIQNFWDIRRRCLPKISAAACCPSCRWSATRQALNNRGRLLIPTQLKKVLAFLHTQHRQTRDSMYRVARQHGDESYRVVSVAAQFGRQGTLLEEKWRDGLLGVWEERHCAPWTKMLLRSCIAKLLPYNGFRQDGL